MAADKGSQLISINWRYHLDAAGSSSMACFIFTLAAQNEVPHDTAHAYPVETWEDFSDMLWSACAPFQFLASLHRCMVVNFAQLCLCGSKVLNTHRLVTTITAVHIIYRLIHVKPPGCQLAVPYVVLASGV